MHLALLDSVPAKIKHLHCQEDQEGDVNVCLVKREVD